MPSKIKKLAVVASGWHFPSQFFEELPKQKKADGWEYEFFCVSHRDPVHAQKEKKGKKFTGDRAYLDKMLYPRVISKEDIQKAGWHYKEYPNTIGDWGNSNQWLEDHDYRKYDMFLFTHDDNLILGDTWFRDIIEDKAFKDWEILCNSAGMPKGSIRGSCEFFKKSLLKKIGGKFDLSDTTLTREGKTSATEDLEELYDWNTTVTPLANFVAKNNIPVGFMSPSYRISAYCIEGERGYIGNTHGINTEVENAGLEVLKRAKII
jgi:hypothetical protein